MVRQYRIDRFNGLEVLVCECYDKHLLSSRESEAVSSWMSDNPDRKYSDFVEALLDFIEDPGNYDDDHKLASSFYGLYEPIPSYDCVPCVTMRGVIVNNRVSSLQVDFAPGITVNVIEYEIDLFLRFPMNVHWRNTVSHQIERYGSLFGSDND